MRRLILWLLLLVAAVSAESALPDEVRELYQQSDRGIEARDVEQSLALNAPDFKGRDGDNESDLATVRAGYEKWFAQLAQLPDARVTQSSHLSEVIEKDGLLEVTRETVRVFYQGDKKLNSVVFKAKDHWSQRDGKWRRLSSDILEIKEI